MTTAMRTNNDGPPRKTLASQIDRLDNILDGLDAALAGAVQEAVEQAVKQAVQAVLTEVLTNRQLQEQLQQTAPPAPPSAEPRDKKSTPNRLWQATTERVRQAVQTVKKMGRGVGMLLLYPAQVRGGASLEAELRGQLLGSLQARLAGELIDAYRQPPCWRDYVDDSAQALRALVQARLQGQKPAEPDLQPTAPPALLDTLRQSVAALREDSATDGGGRHQSGPSRRRSW